jgi:hypothetical protein
MNLAPNFPDDHAMHLLMQLLHEELGLPERKTISLNTSINFDLGCDGADARQLMGSAGGTVRHRFRRLRRVSVLSA